MLQAVTFDATGTLFHSPERGRIYSEVLGRHGLSVDAARAEELIQQVWQEFDCGTRLNQDRFRADPGGAKGWWRRFLERIAAHLDAGSPSPFAAAELFERFSRAEAWQVFPEVPKALDRLAGRKLRLGVVSNWDERLPALLEDLDLDRYFETVVYSADVGVEKPHPAIFGSALSALKLPPAKVLHVGDSRSRDLEGALGVGMQALHLDRQRGAGDLKDLADLTRNVRLASVVEES